uniref:Uncharacterized protein n=1 Tax=Sphaerodactylus townsendi TaxID=933632 RepID=A0ACB8G3M9_9SAUR
MNMDEKEPHMDYHEDDKRFRREEYESNLIQAGLELERDEDLWKLHLKGQADQDFDLSPVGLSLGPCLKGNLVVVREKNCVIEMLKY